jgi:hypothetical protein
VLKLYGRASDRALNRLTAGAHHDPISPTGVDSPTERAFVGSPGSRSEPQQPSNCQESRGGQRGLFIEDGAIPAHR